MRIKFYYLRRAMCMVLALLMVLAVGCRKDPTNDPTQDPPVDDPKPPVDGETAGVGKPSDLRINLLSEPFAVDRSNLRFSWTMNSSKQNETQTAYRIVVAQTASKMEAKEYVFDSEWIESSESAGVEVEGLSSKLKDNTLYYWSVATRDTAGAEAYSDAKPFSTAVGKDWANLAGIWAGKAHESGEEEELATEWTDYEMNVEFSIDANAVGFIIRGMDAKNFYMWQFKIENGKALLCPHVYKDGKFVNNSSIAKIEIPSSVAFGVGDTIHARIECDGDTITTSIKKGEDYVVVDERDMSAYGFAEGTVGVRTGGSEFGKLYAMEIHHMDGRLLYRSNFAGEENPFSKCTIADGALIVSKALSTGDFLDREAAMDFASNKSSDSFVFLRTELNLTADQLAKLDKALLSVTATSPESTRQFVYNMYVNGTIVGVGPSRYGKTPAGKNELFYNTYDVTALLKSGDNCLSTINYTTAGRAFLSQLTLHYTDGTSEVVSNSARDAEKWTSLAADKVFGKNNSIGTNYYLAHANNINSALYPYGFAEASFDDSAWNGVFVGDPIQTGMSLVPSETDNVSRFESTEKVTVKKLDNGDYVIDLGGEIIGGIRFTVTLPAAATLKVYYGEQLGEDGSVKYKMMTTNVYEETWQLTAGKQTIETIDMLAYRYVQISGCPVEITPDMVKGLEIRAPFREEASDFNSDNRLLNDLYDLMKRTIKITTQDLFVDSQSRERLAYEGDLIINLLASYAFGNDYSIGRFSAEYLYTHRTWPAEYYLFAAQFALEDYMVTGDLASLETFYNVIKTRVYTQHLNSDIGLLTSGTSSGPSAENAVLIDWPMAERDGYDSSVTYNTVLNAVAVGTYEALAKIAYATGNDKEAATFEELADGIRTTMIDLLYNEETGMFSDGLTAEGTPAEHCAQHATAYALAYGIYDNQAMADDMAAAIADQGEIRMSVYGSYFLLKGLYESGNGDVANALMLDENVEEGARTWAYMMYMMDATITTEAWNSTIKNNMTLSHAWGAAPAYAITRGIFGITPTTPGYATFDVRFQTEGIGKASIAVPTVKGDVEASFDSTGAAYTASVTVPANTKATIYLPATEGATLTVNGEAAQGSYKNGFISLTVGSGEWNFEVK